MHTLKDITGQRFGKLVVLARHSRKAKGRRYYWLCQCDCGRQKVIRDDALTSGVTRSCSCLQREIATKHGHYAGGKNSPTASSWRAMLGRCTEPSNKRYKYYGGRGITICDRWLVFTNFLADMGACPTGYSIERVDVDGNYEPSNCVWIPKAEQSRNRRNVIAARKAKQSGQRPLRNRSQARLSAAHLLAPEPSSSTKQRPRRRPKAPSAQLEFDL